MECLQHGYRGCFSSPTQYVAIEYPLWRTLCGASIAIGDTVVSTMICITNVTEEVVPIQLQRSVNRGVDDTE